jgi:type IV pilus assembly protein PilV
MHTNRPSSSGGFTLIEAMIALLVMSIAMLAIAMLQVTALREQRNAHYRTSASQLADDMGDRIRLSRALVYYAGAGSNGFLTAETTFAAAAAITPASLTLPSFSQASASSYQIEAWRLAIIDRFGQGAGAGLILPLTGQPSNRQVVLMWSEKQSTASAAAVDPDPNCPATVHCLTFVIAP